MSCFYVSLFFCTFLIILKILTIVNIFNYLKLYKVCYINNLCRLRSTPMNQFLFNYFNGLITFPLNSRYLNSFVLLLSASTVIILLVKSYMCHIFYKMFHLKYVVLLKIIINIFFIKFIMLKVR